MLGVLANFLGAAVFAVIAWQLWKQADRLMGYGDVTSYLRLPLGPIVYFMAALSAATMIAFVCGGLMVELGRSTTQSAKGYE